MLERARRKSDTVEWVEGDLLALPFDDDSFDAATVGFGVRNVADLEAPLWASCAACSGPGGASRSSRSRSRAESSRPFFSLWFDRIVPLLGKVLPGGKAYTYLPASVRRFPGAEDLAALLERQGFERVRSRCSAGRSSRCTPPSRPRRAGVSALETIRAADGLAEYLVAVEERLELIVAAHPGTVAAVGADALAAGGKRLRPTLTFLSAPPGAEAPVVEGVAVELVHMATLIHDDIVDGAHVRRGRAAAWTAHGADAARATGDHLFAAAFAALAATGSQAPVAVLAEASLALARGEALQRLQRHDPSTTVEAYLERCALKTGSLFAAACAPRRWQRRVRPTARGRVPDRRRRPRLHAARPSRPGRSPAPTCATARRHCRSSSPPARTRSSGRRSREGRSRALSSASRRPVRSRSLARRRSTTLRVPGESLDGAVRREELEALVDAVVDRNR